MRVGKRTGGCIGAENDLLWRNRSVQRFEHRFEQGFHAGRRHLHDASAAETIDRESRQPVAFGMDEPVIRFRVKRFAQRERTGKAPGKKFGIDLLVGGAVEQAYGDETLEIEIACAVGATVITRHRDQAASRQCLRDVAHFDFVGEHPRRTGPRAAAFARLEPQERARGHLDGQVGICGPRLPRGAPNP